MPTFDLTREPWIPIRWLPEAVGPHVPSAVGLREVLAEAHRIREIVGDTPLQTAAIYRLLQALFLRLYHESGDEEAWGALWNDGQFDPERVERYFAEWHDEKERFNLVHESRPFFGHPEPLTDSPSAVARLFADESSGNNATLFSHDADDAPRCVPLARVARGLIATQLATLGGGKSSPFYFSDAPHSAGMIFWLRGDTLFQALLLNTPPTGVARILPADDAPAWERPLPASEKRPERGYADYLTWQARRVRLDVADDDGGPSVTGVWFSQGDKWEGTSNDPLMARRKTSTGKMIPYKIRPGRALWRDAHILFATQTPASEGRVPPATFDWIANSAMDADFPMITEDTSFEVDAFGLANSQSKIELMRHERLPIYPRILRSEARQAKVTSALERAERQAGNLRHALRTCVRGMANVKPEDVRRYAASLGGEERYWPRLGPAFYTWLADLAAIPSETDDVALDRALDRHLAGWTETLFDTARSAYDAATEGFTDSGRQLEAVAHGRGELRPAAAYRDLLDQSDSSAQPA